MTRRRSPRPTPAKEERAAGHRGNVSPEASAPEVAPPTVAQGLGAAGNREAGRLLRGSTGQPLEPAVRRRMEGALGAELDEVRIHRDSGAVAEVRRHDAAALTSGDHVAFDAGLYQPGTPVGDALLAHELAHTLQQRDAAWDARSGAARHHEADANTSALQAVRALWGHSTRALVSPFAGVAPRVRSGGALQFFSCKRQPAYETPDFLGEHSLETLEEINDKAEAGRWLGPLIVAGTAVSLATSTPAENLASGSYDITPHAEALRAIPSITRARIITEIQLLLVSHENSMNDQERRFWRNILRELGGL